MNCQRGFTLIEVMAAMFILMIALLPIISMLSASKIQNIEIDRKLKAKHLAQAKLEEIKAMKWQDFKLVYLDNKDQPITVEPLRFDDQYQDGKYLTANDSLPDNDFTYRVKIWSSVSTLLYTIQVTVYYKEAGQEKWEALYTEKLRR